MGEPGARRAHLTARWSALHHGVDPRRVPLVAPWLRFVWALARPLAVVPPTAVTAVGVVLAVDAVLLGPPWAALAVLGAALCDGLDGAMAVLTGRATRLGAVADALADRIADVCFALVLWRCGAPLWAAVVAAILAVAVDGLRRVRHVPAVITVGERPSWTVCAALACAFSAVAWAVTVCVVVWIVLGVIAVVQVVRAPSTAPPGGGSQTIP